MRRAIQPTKHLEKQAPPTLPWTHGCVPGHDLDSKVEQGLHLPARPAFLTPVRSLHTPLCLCLRKGPHVVQTGLELALELKMILKI